MTTEFIRDAAATVAIFGFFASSWFGWAQEAPPAAWRTALVVGLVLSLLIAGLGDGVLSVWGKADLIAPWIALVVGKTPIMLALMAAFFLVQWFCIKHFQKEES